MYIANIFITFRTAISMKHFFFISLVICSGCFPAAGQAPEDPLKMLLDKEWCVERRVGTNTGWCKDSVYIFRVVDADNLEVKTRGKQVKHKHWNKEYFGPVKRIVIKDKLDVYTTFEYQKLKSNDSVLRFEQYTGHQQTLQPEKMKLTLHNATPR